MAENPASPNIIVEDLPALPPGHPARYILTESEMNGINADFLDREHTTIAPRTQVESIEVDGEMDIPAGAGKGASRPIDGAAKVATEGAVPSPSRAERNYRQERRLQWERC